VFRDQQAQQDHKEYRVTQVLMVQSDHRVILVQQVLKDLQVLKVHKEI
jgi:hypothetical protein